MTELMDRIRDGVDEAAVPDSGAGTGAGAVDDESIYRERRDLDGYDQVPWCAYFYYVGKPALADGRRPIAFYQYASLHGPIAYSELRRLTTMLALNARESDPDKQNPKPYTAPFNWTRKSYIIMLVDDPDFAFEKGNAVRIVAEYNGKNHTFFDGVDFDDIALHRLSGGPAIDYVTAVCFINHMKRDEGIEDLRDGEVQRFRTSYSPGMEFEVASLGDKAEALFDFADDGGTNMGPPVPPP